MGVKLDMYSNGGHSLDKTRQVSVPENLQCLYGVCVRLCLILFGFKGLLPDILYKP